MTAWSAMEKDVERRSAAGWGAGSVRMWGVWDTCGCWRLAVLCCGQLLHLQESGSGDLAGPRGLSRTAVCCPAEESVSSAAPNLRIAACSALSQNVSCGIRLAVFVWGWSLSHEESVNGVCIRGVKWICMLYLKLCPFSGRIPAPSACGPVHHRLPVCQPGPRAIRLVEVQVFVGVAAVQGLLQRARSAVRCGHCRPPNTFLSSLGLLQVLNLHCH